MTLIKFVYVGEFTSRRRRVGVGEFARRRVDRITKKMPNILKITSVPKSEKFGIMNGL